MIEKREFDRKIIGDLRKDIREAQMTPYVDENEKLSLKKLITELFDDLQQKLDDGWTLEMLANFLRDKLNTQFNTMTLRNYLNSIRKARKKAAASGKRGKRAEDAGCEDADERQNPEGHVWEKNPEGHIWEKKIAPGEERMVPQLESGKPVERTTAGAETPPKRSELTRPGQTTSGHKMGTPGVKLQKEPDISVREDGGV